MKKFEFMQDHEENKKGDIVEYDENEYHTVQHPLIMRGILKDTEKKFNKKKKVKETINMDLDGDGDVDADDVSIAAKVLRSSRKIKDKQGDK